MLKNAIVVMFDSLQFNYLGCYGNSWIKTPNMDRMAREGVLFENCYTEGLPTVPCRRAMLTGRYTLPTKGWSALDMQDTTIADLCWGRPIDTAMIFDAGPLRLPKFGYTRGFDKVWYVHGHESDQYFFYNDTLYHDAPENHMIDTAFEFAKNNLGEDTVKSQMGEIYGTLLQAQYWKSDEDRYVAKTIKESVKYLKGVDRTKQFFLWIDSFDPHEPWNSPSVYLKYPCPYDPEYVGKSEFLPFMGEVAGMYTDRELHHIRMLYAECVTVCDKWFGYLLDNIRELGFEQNTLLMMVSDHGEPLGKGENGHGIMRKVRPWPYEELAHTPMLLRCPDIKAGQRIPAFVQSCDVAPTICDWLGIGVHPDMQGKSLLPLCRGEVSKVRDFAIAGYYSASWAIYTEDWSYIHWPQKDKETISFMSDFMDNMSKCATNNEPVDTTTLKSMQGEKAYSDNEAYRLNKAAATLDGEDQWTCTPGAAYITPEADELYNRKTDSFQLHNIIKENEKIAEDLLKTLKAFMSELKSS